MKMTATKAVEKERSRQPAPRTSGLPTHAACPEFEPQNLGVVAVDRNRQIIEANDAFLSMTGYLPGDLPLHMAEITPSAWHELDERKMRQLADSAYCLPWEKEIVTRQGRRLPIVMGAVAFGPTEHRFQFFIVCAEKSLPADSVVLEYQSRLRRAAAELSLSAERERRAVAADLHDNIGQELAIAKLKLSKLRGETIGTIGPELDEIVAQLSRALSSCRRLSYGLATPALYKLGLVPALKNLIATLNKDQDLDISLRFESEDTPLPVASRIILYRAVRELLVNVLKHAQATSVEISGTQVGELLTVVIADDGIGCDAARSFVDTNPEQGLGLFLIRERMWHIGGSFELASTPGKGTRVTLVVPLGDAQKEAGPPE